MVRLGRHGSDGDSISGGFGAWARDGASDAVAHWGRWRAHERHVGMGSVLGGLGWPDGDRGDGAPTTVKMVAVAAVWSRDNAAKRRWGWVERLGKRHDAVQTARSLLEKKIGRWWMFSQNGGNEIRR